MEAQPAAEVWAVRWPLVGGDMNTEYKEYEEDKEDKEYEEYEEYEGDKE